MSKNVPRKEMPQTAFTTQAASFPSLFYLLGSGEKMQRFRRGFLKLCELVPRFPCEGRGCTQNSSAGSSGAGGETHALRWATVLGPDRSLGHWRNIQEPDLCSSSQHIP